MAYEVPPLPYDYAALEPHIDEATMKLHHDKHHAAYVAKLNGAIDLSPALAIKAQKEARKQAEAEIDLLPPRIEPAALAASQVAVAAPAYAS